MPNPGFDDYVSVPSAKIHTEPSGGRIAGHLLWGDGVKLLGEKRQGKVKVRARGRKRIGWIASEDLGGESLLEVYFIDVGQGDGVLVKTPDFRHVMIDGGHPRRSQMTGKNAADFVDWKFFEDYGLDHIELEAMIASHNDYDHYGGLADLLDTAQEEELDAKGVSVEAFYHAGMSWWVDANGKRTLGKTEKSGGREFYVQLLEDRASAESAVNGGGRAHRLQGAWKDFIEKVVSARRRNGRPTPIARLSQRTQFLPGFGPGHSDALVRVLGPVEFEAGGAPGLPKLGAESKSTNGNSVLLRVDYGRARILLTGDLNKASQQLLLDAFSGQRLEFQCDVAKACHHGSEDVSFSFLQAMSPAVTVISSGDGEGHDHPRPRVVAASGATGHLSVEDDEIVTPLVYSTELARSTAHGKATAIELVGANGQVEQRVEGAALSRARVSYQYTKPGALRPQSGQRPMNGNCIVVGLVYGLVNVRTDGKTILTATLNEGNGSWSVKSFQSRF